MPRPLDQTASRQLLQAQLENYKATREACREPQRSIFTALIQQIERELCNPLPGSRPAPAAPQAPAAGRASVEA
jgi:hypothetical protein